MIRTYEKEVSWKAGALAIGVHLASLGALLISFNWKAAHPVLNIAEVALWDSLPNNAVQKPEPIVEPIVKETIKSDSVQEEKPKEESQVDIALDKKKKELVKNELERKELERKELEQK